MLLSKSDLSHDMPPILKLQQQIKTAPFLWLAPFTYQFSLRINVFQASTVSVSVVHSQATA